MSPVGAIVAKELRTAFVSPIVYVVGAVFLLCFGVLSYLFVQIAGTVAIRQMQLQGAAAQLNLNDLVFRPLFSWSAFILLMILLPILTMRLFAEERKLRTFELLMTSPIGVNEIVVGKFLSVFIVFLGLLVLTGVVPLILSLYSSFDWNPVLTGYLALMLTGAMFLATGAFASALTENQIVAVLVSFGILFSLWLVGVAGMSMGDTPLGTALSYLSFGEHFDRLIRGLVETKDLAYYLCGMVFMLFLAHRVVESQRWK
jgi:ABC-2 type transport system permease protein